MYNYKRLVGELLGAAIAVVWIAFALLGQGCLVFLVVAISLTIFYSLGDFWLYTNNKKNKEI